jgi:hypothetical protein
LEIADATLGGLAFGVGMTTYSHKVKDLATGSNPGDGKIKQFNLSSLLFAPNNLFQLFLN